MTTRYFFAPKVASLNQARQDAAELATAKGAAAKIWEYNSKQFKKSADFNKIPQL